MNNDKANAGTHSDQSVQPKEAATTGQGERVDTQNTSTDADNDSLTTGRIAATERSSASSTKTNVTGSDLDGQTSF